MQDSGSRQPHADATSSTPGWPAPVPARTALPKLLFILGVPGSGKTTLANYARTAAEYQPFHGGMRLRRLVRQQPDSSVAACVKKGEPVSPSVFTQLVAEAAPTFKDSWVCFDGYPRNRTQADATLRIADILGVSRADMGAIKLVIDEEHAAERLRRRYECPRCGMSGHDLQICPECQEDTVARSVDHDTPVHAASQAGIDEAAEYLSGITTIVELDATKTPDELWYQAVENFRRARLRHLQANWLLPPPAEVEDDLDHLMRSFALHGIRRFFHQRYFEDETREAEFASRIEVAPRLETVAEHSWHVADGVMLFAPQFPEINLSRAVELAVIHDKMEIFVGDIDPIGRNGTGSKSHAFNQNARARKHEKELAAIATYVASLAPGVREYQESLLREALDCVSQEAQFMKSVDKLTAIAFILHKKAGKMEDKQLKLVYDLTARNAHYYLGLAPHHWALARRVFRRAADRRGVSPKELCSQVLPPQITLF